MLLATLASSAVPEHGPIPAAPHRAYPRALSLLSSGMRDRDPANIEKAIDLLAGIEAETPAAGQGVLSFLIAGAHTGLASIAAESALSYLDPKDPLRPKAHAILILTSSGL